MSTKLVILIGLPVIVFFALLSMLIAVVITGIGVMLFVLWTVLYVALCVYAEIVVTGYLRSSRTLAVVPDRASASSGRRKV